MSTANPEVRDSALTVTTPDGDFAAFVALPAATPAPVVVVIQEIFGINEDMRETCRKLASQGYVAVCPDLFWRQEPGVSITDKTQEEWDKAMKLYTGFDVDNGVSDIIATIATALKRPDAVTRVGVVGYCLGGLLSFLTATRTKVDAAVSYYGVGIDKHLDEASNVKHGLLMHIAEADEFVPAEARQKIVAGLSGNPHVEIHTYPGCSHAFARHAGVHYNAVSAKLANARSTEFFAKYLK
ncbi:dienelactone hydrolase family protein [Pseudomonas schmalbachii]|uniref:Dienelactone hydrolase family protein n=1 Tax=Pseudomonas schmalbachii TaxID=2816993 RepID=A0ABS3TKW5_9PSED|nr:dienelactone hydrolase family protein [Pseudomonas schmalbachii]MBO3274302.1 dienelactone hydrolase family protein [Pseudomonas schmalbachii]